MTASNSCFGRSHFTPPPTIRLFLVALVATQYNVPSAAGQLCAQLSGVNFTENFNSLSGSGSNNTSSSVPSEFAFVESPGNLTYAADNGSNTAADTYSYGATGSSGSMHQLEFLGKEGFDDDKFTLTFQAEPTMTNLEKHIVLVNSH